MSENPIARAEHGCPRIGEEDRRLLLAAARSALARHLAGGAAHPRAGPPAPEPPLPEHHGVFVSLRMADELKGCIGILDPETSLLRAVEGCAVSAASDPRFTPLAADELPRTHIEISVLGPSRRIRTDSEITIGKDGVKVSLGSRRGLLLPQVALQQDWEARRFLQETCIKAGLPPDAWRWEETVVEVFSAEVFAEPVA